MDSRAAHGRLVAPWPCPRLDTLALLFRLHSEGLAARTLTGPVPTHGEMQDLLRWEQRSTRELKQVFDAHGWPGVRMVGEIGAEAAWWVVLLCDRHTPFQRDALDLLNEAVEAGDAPARHAAHLGDRLLMHEGKPQTHGTQWVLHDDGSVSLYPVADPAALTERRRAVDLPEAGTESDVRLLSLTRRPRLEPRPQIRMPHPRRELT
ncbi:DUF6624 domain-containing protein [Streptomyces olivoreticuli]|uniref:DUF6624 domain-containing protein n=1 Tax=Streptomyces olivoreticuli TaxID=68246 RepID=UPI000E223725|nr:DUF6624 domain-containing protein [Streptomyces olivoreticuli]